MNSDNIVSKTQNSDLMETNISEIRIPTIQTNNIQEDFKDYSKISQRRIFFDMSHEQLFSPWDTGFFGYSNFTMLLKDYFLDVSTITTSLSEKVQNMTSEDILFLNVAKNAHYSPSEITYITNFVVKGGKLIIIGEHNTTGFKEFQNPLLNEFDMNITDMNINDPLNNTGYPDWIIFNSTYFNLTNLSYMFTAVLDVYGNAFSIANTSIYANYPNQTVMGCYNNSNGGKVFCSMDSEWLWNGNNSYCGINYGNNSRLMLKILDWMYNSNLSEYIREGFEVIPEYELFTCSQNNNFTLNMTITKEINVSVEIDGGNIFPMVSQNLLGSTQWEINVTKNGYAIFRFTKPSLNINFTKTLYFFEGNGEKKVLFIHHDYSRTIEASSSNLLKLALSLRYENFSVYTAGKQVNYSQFDSIFIANPLRSFNISAITALQQAEVEGSKIVFLNAPYCTLDVNDVFGEFFRVVNSPKTVPINLITNNFGFNFSHHILCGDQENLGEIYVPRITGVNNTFYNLSSYMASIINTSLDYTKELIGYNDSWGEDRSIFGLSGSLGTHIADINNTCVMAYTNKIMALGILSFFTNEYFNPNHFFNDFLCNWLLTGKFNQKISVQSNVIEFHFTNTHYKITSTQDIRDLQGQKVPNGTIFNIILSKGQIVSEDAMPGIPGFQIKAFNASINLTCTTGTDLGLCELSIYNSTGYHIIMSLFLNFSDDGDDVNPNITVNLPPGKLYWSTPPPINVSASDLNLHYIWYNVTGNAQKEFLQNNTVEYLNDTLWALLDEGEFKISFYANDTWGNVNNTFTYTLYKDTYTPNININLPVNNTYHDTPPRFNFTAWDNVLLHSIWYQIGLINNNVTNHTDHLVPNYIWDSIPQGPFTVYVFANDTAGNVNKTFTLSLYKDLYAPNISINLPLNNTYWNSAPMINLTVYELFPEDIWYNVSGFPEKKFLVNNSNIALDSNIWTNLNPGMFEISFYANDSYGHLNDSFTLVLYKDISAPNISILNPINGTNVYSAPNILVLVEDMFLDTIWYNISGNPTQNPIQNNTRITLNFDLWNALPIGEFNITFFARDLAGNMRNLTITLIKAEETTDNGEDKDKDDKDDSSPDGEAPILLYVIIGITAVGGIIGITIYVKKNKYKWQRY